MSANRFTARQLAATAGTALRPLWHLVSRYPLLLLVVVALGALAYGTLLHEYDAFHLLWNESPVVGFVNGGLMAFALGAVLVAVHLTDLRVAAAAVGPPPPGWAYRAAWAVLLGLFALPAVGKGDPPLDGVSASAAWRWWFPLGLAGVAAMHLGLGFATGGMKSTPRVGRYVVLGLAAGYLCMVAVHSAVPGAYCPFFPASVSALLLFLFLAAVLGAVTYLAQDRRRWLYPVLLVLVVLPFAFPQNQIENRLPGMTDAATGESYYARPTRLARYDELRPPDRAATRDPNALPAELLAWNDRMSDEFGEPQPVVLVACSGGASASAVYTADVLFTLEAACPGFARRVRVISGASGGMLGASYFVSQLRPGGLLAAAQDDPAARTYRALLRRRVPATSPEFVQVEAAYRDLMAGVREEFFRGLEADFLGPLVQKWVHRDMPISPFGLFGRLDARLGHTTNDRGSALERAWAVHLRGGLDVPFRDLRAAELAGELPSLVFTPMMVEDGRQLIVSNLDLDYMTETGRRTDAAADYLSYMGVEFFKLFPGADRFKLSTAVRMNASFPLFSPAAALPTDPVRHVVDAGYYDNYGMVAATKWLLHPPNRAFLADKGVDDRSPPGRGPEVLLLRVRCFGDQQTPRMIPTAAELERYAGRDVSPTDLKRVAGEWAAAPPDRPPVRTENGLFTVTAPLTGLFSAWRANMTYRADERLSAVLREYRNPIPRSDGVMVKVTVNEFPLFCRTEPSLNWVLTRRDRDAIHEDVRRDLARPLAWANFFNGRGGSPDPDLATAPAPPAAGEEEAGTTAFVEAMWAREAALRSSPGQDALTVTQSTSLDGKRRLAGKVSQMAVSRR